MRSLAVRKGILKDRGGPLGIAIHTTGAGPAYRVNPALDPKGKFARWRARYPEAAASTFEAAKWLYENVMVDSPHALVGQNGESAILAPACLAARHIGSRNSKGYKRGANLSDSKYGYWREEYPHLIGPQDLLGGRLWTMASANALLYGIEVAPDPANPRGPWSDAAWEALATVVARVATKYGIPRDPEHIFPHSIAHPIARSARGQRWDPNPTQYTWERLRVEMLVL